jgi:hypothetical protein
MHRSACLWLVWLPLGLAACGGAVPKAIDTPTAEPPPPATPAMGPHVPVTELDALQRDLDVSAEQLDRQLALARREPAEETSEREAEPAPKRDASKKEKAPKGATRGGSAESGADEAVASAGTPAPPGSQCDLLCRALGSMRRAADGICNLTAEQDARCSGARNRVKLATEQVASVGCACVK